MQIHILNGDALKDQLGQKFQPYIVFRECMIDGPKESIEFELFWRERALFFQNFYQVSHDEYFDKARKELERLLEPSQITEINLWFEFDLFCLSNLWFLVQWLNQHRSLSKIFWVYPTHYKWSGFGSMTGEQFQLAFDQRKRLNPDDITFILNTWNAYRTNDLEKINSLVEKLPNSLVTMKEALKAATHFLNLSSDDHPQNILKGIIKKQISVSFGEIFNEFSSKHGVFGLGDLQIKLLLKKINWTT